MPIKGRDILRSGSLLKRQCLSNSHRKKHGWQMPCLARLTDSESLYKVPNRRFFHSTVTTYSSDAKSTDKNNRTISINNARKSNNIVGCVELARVCVPTDANWAGNCHGGTIMKMIEEAAGVAANRYFNHDAEKRIFALNARMDRMTFLSPVHIGDVAKVQARVVFASDHTVAVSVRVLAERMSRRNKRPVADIEDDVCNQALVWMVGMFMPENQSAVELLRKNPKALERAKAPPFPMLDPEDDPELYQIHQLAAESYERRKNKKQIDICSSEEVPIAGSFIEPGSVVSGEKRGSAKDIRFTPDYSAVELAQVMLPSDCYTPTGLVAGGTILKLADNACGIACIRHCGTNVVTISVDSVNLMAPVLMGDVIRVQARPTFTSSKSIEFQVNVIAERFVKNPSSPIEDDKSQSELIRENVVIIQNAYFTFVSLALQSKESGVSDENNVKSLPMRPLVIQTIRERERFEAGRRRYEKRKQERIKMKEQKERSKTKRNGDEYLFNIGMVVLTVIDCGLLWFTGS
jgi:acyl-coenzyme A thioesterase 7